VGAILVQNTAWTNATRALDNLKVHGALSVEEIESLPDADLSDLIRPSGHYNQKTLKLKSFCSAIRRDSNGDIAQYLSQPAKKMRQALLDVWGIGEETADTIMLYAAKLPRFIVDTYTIRTLQRIGITPLQTTKQDLQTAIMKVLPHDPSYFAEAHALMIQHGKNTCRKTPNCKVCIMNSDCLSANTDSGIQSLRTVSDRVKTDYWG
tara:strand:- start:664 stop:1284 length:621 start_codon:yes stop_codon:yes gene_type:complete